MQKEWAFKIWFTDRAKYDQTKSQLLADLKSFGIAPERTVSFDDGGNGAIISHQSYGNLLCILSDTASYQNLGLFPNAYIFFEGIRFDNIVIERNTTAYVKERLQAEKFMHEFKDLSQPPEPRGIRMEFKHLQRVLLARLNCCIGEAHGHNIPKIFVSSAMAKIAGSNKVILLEGLPTNFNDLLSDYLVGKEDRLPAEIERLIAVTERRHSGFKYLRDIMFAAKKHGVQVRGIETPFSIDTYQMSDFKEEGTYYRCLMMNANATRFIKQANAEGKGTVLLCGRAHLLDVPNPNNRIEIAIGMSRLLGASIIGIEDGQYGVHGKVMDRGGVTTYIYNEKKIREPVKGNFLSM